MKMKFLIIFSAVFLMSIPHPAGAQEASLVPYVTVSGYAEDWIEPDVAVWDITIQQKGKEMRDLKAVAMAEVLGGAVGQPLIISEYPIITDYAQVDRLSMQAGLIQRASPERVHLREQVYIRFNLEARVD